MAKVYFLQTKALRLFVFENESHVWAERKNAGFVSQKNIIENMDKTNSGRSEAFSIHRSRGHDSFHSFSRAGSLGPCEKLNPDS